MKANYLELSSMSLLLTCRKNGIRPKEVIAELLTTSSRHQVYYNFTKANTTAHILVIITIAVQLFMMAYYK